MIMYVSVQEEDGLQGGLGPIEGARVLFRWIGHCVTVRLTLHVKGEVWNP